MKIINNNLKKAGIFNTLLILSAIILRIVEFINVDNIVVRVNIVISLIALAFALFYAFNGYKKDSAKYYKVFMALLTLNLFARIFSEAAMRISLNVANVEIFSIAHAAMFICAFVLAFIKDLGREKSTYMAYVMLILNIVLLGISIMISDNIYYHIGSYCNLIITCIAVVFVSAKYNDKEDRGTI